MKGSWHRVSAVVLAAAILLGTGCSPRSVATAPPALNAVDQIKRNGSLIVGVTNNLPPFRMKDSTGQTLGFDIAVAKAIADELGVKLIIRQYSIAGIIGALNSTMCDIAVGMREPRDPQIKKTASFSEPYFVSGKALLVSRNYPGIQSWRDLDRNENIIAVASENVDIQIFKNAKIKKLRTPALAAFEVVSGGAAAAVDDWPWVKAYQQAHQAQTYAVLQPFTTDNCYIVVSRSKPELLDWLNKFLVQYKAGEDYKKAYRHWFTDMPWIKMISL